MVSSDHIDCHCCNFNYTYWTIQLHVRVGNVQETEKFVDQRLGCHSRGVSVNDATCTVIRFAVSRLGVFLCGLQHSVPGISHNVSYWFWLKKHQFKAWMTYSPQELCFPTHEETVYFSIILTIQKHQKYKEITWNVQRFICVWIGQNFRRIFKFY